MPQGAPATSRGWVPLLAFAALALALSLAGYLTYDRFAGEIKRERQEDLTAIATFKAHQVTEWIRARRADGDLLMHAPGFTTLLDRWIAAGKPEGEFREALPMRLDLFRRLGRYHSVELLDAGGDRIHASGPKDAATPQELGFARAALAEGKLSLSEIHWEGAQGASMLGIDVVAPLSVRAPGGRRNIGAVLFRIDPREYLFPLLQYWPAPSPSAESFLVRIEGPEMLYLNDLRFDKDAALRMRAPAGAATLVGAMLLRRGTEGAVEGVDYRGVPVLAAGLPVPGTDWFMVSKVDRDEVYAPLRGLARLFSAAVFLLVAGAGATVWLWWRGQRAAFAATRYRLEIEREKLTERLGFLSRYANDIILLATAEGRIIDANERALQAYGFSREELLSMHARDFRAPEAAATFERDFETITRLGERVFETIHRRKDGTTFPVEISTRLFEAGGERLWQSIMRDISERKATEARAAQLSRSLRMLSLCNEALVRATDEKKLLEEICKTIVEVGGYRMAWVGFAEQDEAKTVRPIAWAGAEQDYFDGLRVSWADTEHGRGVVGSAIRTGQPVTVDDVASDPRVALWREMLLRHGYRWAVALPLTAPGKVFGALCAYSSEPHAFGEEEAALLAELAGDLAYGLGALRTSAEQSAILAGANIGIAVIRDRKIERCNQALARMFGYDEAQLTGLPTRAFHESDESYEAFGRDSSAAIREGKASVADLKSLRADGSAFWVNVSMSAIDPGDLSKGVIAVVQDIDQRKCAERILSDQAQQLRELSRSLFEAEEKVRRDLARELHDRVGHNITALNLNFHVFHGELPHEGREKLRPRLTDCETLLSQTAQMVRDVMTDLRPAGIDELGLVAALTEHARQMSARAKLPISVEGAEAQPRLAAAMEITLYRIAEEALVNVVKHAKATAVTIGFEAGPERVVLTVADNGRGFEPAARAGETGVHLGLVGLRERAEAIGGVLRVESAPGRGTRVIVEAPRASAAQANGP